jgi:hypothetical protein
VDPFISPDIEAGAVWNAIIAGALEDTNIGIACMTSKNLESTWIHFESGAISKVTRTSRVVPYLINIEPADIVGPLVRFQAKSATRQDTLDMISQINDASPSPLPQESLLILFNARWPALEAALEQARAALSLPENRQERDPGDMMREVLERVRRIERDGGAAIADLVELADGIHVHLPRLEVHRHGSIVSLTPREGEILAYIRANRARVVTREELLRDVWGYKDPRVETRTVDIHIVGLRRKIEPDPEQPTLIQSVRGQGYRWGGG